VRFTLLVVYQATCPAIATALTVELPAMVDSSAVMFAPYNCMKKLLQFLRSFKRCRNRRRHSRLPFLGESMAWFNSSSRRS